MNWLDVAMVKQYEELFQFRFAWMPMEYDLNRLMNISTRLDNRFPFHLYVSEWNFYNKENNIDGRIPMDIEQNVYLLKPGDIRYIEV